DEAAALVSHRHATEIDPAYADPVGTMALLALQHQDPGTARAYAEQALALDPAQPAAALALARLAVQEGRPAEAIDRLALARDHGRAAPPQQDALAHRVRGDALDALGRKTEAFDAYAASAAIFRRRHARACAGPQPLAGLDLCHRLRDGYRAADAALWQPAGSLAETGGGAVGHVFVVGFPRSGTTLLEQVLASHPQVVALEEQTTLMPAIDAYLDPPDNIDALAHMDEAAADHWRRDYWARVRSFGVDPAGKVFVDKQPFYTLWLPLIGKLFPEARIVVARRDPRDVVLSCFRRPFRMTPVTYELMDLERSARLYAGAMDILAVFLERSRNPSLIYRHEDLVADFDAVAGRLCDFLGLPWTDLLREFPETARKRPIRTPSAPQVRKGLNRDGIEAWRGYAVALAPVLLALEPYVQAFGYSA
ncbi:MAG: sulfotransferase family protein, partial [Caulobacteraceae bacterium]|nr:sulfotransferase family protein [Caulobacteraceae bacterium]